MVSAFIDTQIQAGYMIGPFRPQDCSGVTVSQMAVIPKKTPGKWRVIVNLSAPAGRSVNDNLHRHLTHVSYSSPSDAALLLHSLGPGSLMAKIDLRDAYRMVPIHPADRPFLGLSWQGSTYVDLQLPFGLASAPAIFNALAEPLEWVLRAHGVRFMIHYLDNFLLLGPPNSDEWQQALHTTLTTCHELGVLVAQEKLEGPTTCLSFLGIEFNSSSMSLRLPECQMMAVWSG